MAAQDVGEKQWYCAHLRTRHFKHSYIELVSQQIHVCAGMVWILKNYGPLTIAGRFEVQFFFSEEE